MKKVFIYLKDNLKWHGDTDENILYSEDYNLVVFNKINEIQYYKGWITLTVIKSLDITIKEHIDTKDIEKMEVL